MMVDSGPLITDAWVTGYDAVNHRVYVILHDGQQLPVPVRVLMNGPADLYAVNQVEMPKPGTKVAVAFINHDMRNGILLGSFFATGANTITSDSTEPFLNFFAHWTGNFEYMDQIGQTVNYYPDGTYIQVAQDITALPTLYQNTLDANGIQQRVSVDPASRVSMVPSPGFQIYIKHSSGTDITIDNSGNVIITLNSGATFQLNNTSDALALVSKLLTAFNSHTHTSVSPGNGASGPPYTPWQVTDIESDLAKTSG